MAAGDGNPEGELSVSTHIFATASISSPNPIPLAAVGRHDRYAEQFGQSGEIDPNPFLFCFVTEVDADDEAFGDSTDLQHQI